MKIATIEMLNKLAARVKALEEAGRPSAEKKPVWTEKVKVNIKKAKKK